ncbi:copper resistance protein NlpE [Akkermansia glycaniphila]|nr:copper resistance protein NlpE [Akkermansia glycaniphila]
MKCILFLLSMGAALPAVHADEAGRPVSQSVAAVPAMSAWCGVYEGTLPAADCEGILVQLTLNADMTCKKVTIYLGVQDEAVADEELTDLNDVFRSVEGSLPEVQEGTLDWSDDGKTLVVHTEEGQELYELDKDGLHMLNADGKRVTGPLAPYYVLKKAESESGTARKGV